MENRYTSKLEKWENELGGVFTLSDLRILFADSCDSAIYKRLTALQEDGILIKVLRGLYATRNASLEAISARIFLNSYISTGNILGKNMIIGSVPARKIQAVKVGRPRVFECPLGIIEFLSISPKLFFGFTSQKGIQYATPEKAYLDVCYFFYKGKSFSFDLDSDINRELLNAQLIEDYLTKYDKRFVSFFRKLWND